MLGSHSTASDSKTRSHPAWNQINGVLFQHGSPPGRRLSCNAGKILFYATIRGHVRGSRKAAVQLPAGSFIHSILHVTHCTSNVCQHWH